LRVRRPGSRREYDLIAIPDCPVHSPGTRAVVRGLGQALSREWGPELPLAFVLVAGALVTLVLKARPEAQEAWQTRLAGLPWADWGVEGAWLNFNPSAGERVLASGGWRLLWGREQATFMQGSNPMVYGPDSFSQQLPALHEQSLERARDYLDPGPGDRVVDLCSGTGATLRMWRERGAHALGVELGAEAVRCAELNAGPGACLRGKASERLPQIREWLGCHASQGRAGRVLAYANPPRLGLEPEVTDWLAGSESPVERLAYLSCSAGTLGRDLGRLEAGGNRVEALVPYDFFPQTSHVETLALLSRGGMA
jgi:tRNA/tmRNA/rRNA uracil-C5-methylase (TrmA/RlmC/RlmD family)